MKSLGGYVEFTASETGTYRMLGLSSSDTNQNYAEIKYGIELATSGMLYVYESGGSEELFNGARTSTMGYAANDTTRQQFTSKERDIENRARLF